MAFVYKNENPLNKNVDDCVIRAIATVTGMTWDDVFMGLMVQARMMKDLPNSNVVWGSYLEYIGFSRYLFKNTCPLCYTIEDFAIDNPVGRYVVGDGSHAVAVVNGDYIDTYDSGDRTVLFAYKMF